jgi:hypothetical protein
MVEVAGHYDGRQVVLDAPVPDGVAPNARVRVVFEDAPRPASLSLIAAAAVRGGLPPDFAHQHDHYVKGFPKALKLKRRCTLGNRIGKWSKLGR